MADSTFETEMEARGGQPAPIVAGPIFAWPPRPVVLAKYLFGIPGYFLPMNILYMGTCRLQLVLADPGPRDHEEFWRDWVAIIYGRNLALTLLVFGGLHWRFYMHSAQGDRFMLNRKEPTVSHRRFLFGNQVRENIFWTAGSAVIVWTAYEVDLWAFANGYIPMLNWEEHPVYFVLLFCAIPIIRDAHFISCTGCCITAGSIAQCISCTTRTWTLARGPACRCTRLNTFFILVAHYCIGSCCPIRFMSYSTCRQPALHRRWAMSAITSG